MKRYYFLFACFALLSFIAIRVYNKRDKIEQTVVENDLEPLLNRLQGYYLTSPLSEKMSFEEYEKLIREKHNAPYKLTTSYKELHIVIDYGTFKEIDSIKVIRYGEMKLKADKMEHELEEANNRKKNELKLLNKPCN